MRIETVLPPQVATARGGDATHVAPATRELPVTTDSHPHPHRWRCRASGEPLRLPGSSAGPGSWPTGRSRGSAGAIRPEMTVINGIGTTELPGHAQV